MTKSKEVREKVMQEKQVLSIEEIESPTLLELSDDELEGVEGGNYWTYFVYTIFNLGGGGGGGGGGAGGNSD
jgi:hypothetical protein